MGSFFNFFLPMTFLDYNKTDQLILFEIFLKKTKETFSNH